MADERTRLPPHDLQAEEALLGSILIGGILNDGMASLKAGDFYYEQNSAIYTACKAIADRGEPLNQLSVAQELNAAKRLESSGGVAHLSHLISDVVATPMDGPYYAKLVKRYSVYRSIVSLSDKIAAIAYAGGPDAAADIARVQEEINELRRQGTGEELEAENINAPPETMKVKHCFMVGELGPMMPEGTHSTIFTQGGAGKSLLGDDYWPVLLSTGIPDSIFYPQGQYKVLVCDWEATEDTHRRYITAIKNGLRERVDDPDALDGPKIHYLHFDEPITLHQHEIREYIKHHEINVAVFDSQIAAMAGASTTMTDEQRAGVYYNILSSFKCTTLTIDHIKKADMGSDNAIDAPFGSVVKYQLARSVFGLKQQSEAGEDRIELGFTHTKNNLGRKMKPFGIRIDFHNAIEDNTEVLDKVTVTEIDLADAGKLEKLRPTWQRARDAILQDFGGRATVKQVAERIGTTEGTVRDCFNHYTTKFEKVGGSSDGALWGVRADV